LPNPNQPAAVFAHAAAKSKKDVNA